MQLEQELEEMRRVELLNKIAAQVRAAADCYIYIYMCMVGWLNLPVFFSVYLSIWDMYVCIVL